MLRTDIINYLINKHNYISYLEIGTSHTYSNFDKIVIEKKVSIEPNPKQGESYTFIGTSDEYFDSISNDVKFDIIFIDGLHLKEQVLKDINNSLNHLNENGVILCHDCLPTDKEMQLRTPVKNEWTGDVWKAILELRILRDDLDIKVVDTDFGCGLITKGKNKKYIPKIKEYDSWEYYSENKNEMLNVITIDDLKNL